MTKPLKHRTQQLLATCLLLLTSFNVLAQQPSAAQIEQFKKLPPSQQQALAKQYGVDLGSIGGNGNAQPNLGQQPVSQTRRQTNTVNSRAIEDNASEAGDEIVLKEVQSTKVTRQKLKQFGYSLFDSEPSSFMPATDIPIPSEYIMGPGDHIVVQLYGKENASHAFTVNREGQIQFPEIGPVNVAGLNFIELKEMIKTTVEKQMIGVKASITMGELRSIRIFILGEAQQPGSYTVSSLSTMTNALLASGGISKIGSLRNIQLKRSGKLVTTLDLYDLLLNGDTSGDTRLLPGDVIFIPPIGKTVGVSGEVRRPAIYELKNETKTRQVIALAGGFLPTAYPQASRIERINNRGDRTLVDIDLKSAHGKNYTIKDADILQVFSVLETMEDVVLIEGHVERPGGFSWRESLRFSSIIRSANELLPNPDLNGAIIVREKQPTRQISVQLFSPAKAFSNPGGSDDPLLQPRDKIIIFDYETNRAETVAQLIKRLNVQASKTLRRQVVAVGGHVRFPGDYPLTSNMSSTDLINLAGGLTDRAFSLGAEITRYKYTESQQQTVEHIKVNLANAIDVNLSEEDFLHIQRIPNWIGTETVAIEGEVVFPGKYTIQRGETLSQVIERAGGLNEYAFADAAVFTRSALRNLEAQRLKELRERLSSDIAAANIEQQDVDGKIAIDDAEQLLKNLNAVKPMGRMVINVSEVLENPTVYDVVLKDGDMLRIPRFRQSVTVVGEVQFSTSHIFENKLNAHDYVARSGGPTQKADEKRIYVVKADGSVYLPKKSSWFKRRKNVIEPGDTVVVPLDADRIKSLTLWTSVSQIFYQIGLGAAAIASF